MDERSRRVTVIKFVSFALGLTLLIAPLFNVRFGRYQDGVYSGMVQSRLGVGEVITTGTTSAGDTYSLYAYSVERPDMYRLENVHWELENKKIGISTTSNLATIDLDTGEGTFAGKVQVAGPDNISLRTDILHIASDPFMVSSPNRLTISGEGWYLEAGSMEMHNDSLSGGAVAVFTGRVRLKIYQPKNSGD